MSSGCRVRCSSHQHELGDWMRARRAPDERLSGLLLDRELLGYQHSRAQFASWLEPPRPQLTLMIDLDGGLTANGERLPDAWIGGLDDRPTIVGFGDAYGSIDLKLTPLGAYTLTGLPLTELTGACVSLEDVFGRDGSELAARVRELEDWDARFDLVEAFLLGRVAGGPRPDPAVEWAWQRLCASRGAVRVEALARELGCSRRYLSDGFRRQVGLPPKTVARLLRFQAVRDRIEHAPGRWSEVAHAAGYADQSHLNREFRELAGTTPTDFVRRLIPEGGVVGDASHKSKTRKAARASVSAMSDPHRPNIFPAVRYRDADAGVQFLKRAFGATEKTVYRGDDGVIHHGELALGAGLVMVGQYSEDGWLGGDPPRPLSSTVSIYIVVDDPDRHRAVAGEAGATIVRELEDTDYGSREYSARDPEGNLWSFGTYDPYAGVTG